jgi:ubiquinone/menaquinone biosynthesis C-methylase UbiE
MHSKHFDPAHAERLHSAERQAELPLDRLFERLGDLRGQRWAELGAGSGFATVPLAAAVGSTGHVWAVDVEPRMLDLLRQRLLSKPQPNVELVCAPAEQLALADGSLDGVLSVAVWHELDDRPAVLGLCRRLLKAGGRLVIVDWLHPDDAAAGLPAKGPPLDHRLRQTLIVDELAAAGFNVTVQRDCYLAHYVAIGHNI